MSRLANCAGSFPIRSRAELEACTFTSCSPTKARTIQPCGRAPDSFVVGADWLSPEELDLSYLVRVSAEKISSD